MASVFHGGLANVFSTTSRTQSLTDFVMTKNGTSPSWAGVGGRELAGKVMDQSDGAVGEDSVVYPVSPIARTGGMNVLPPDVLLPTPVTPPLGERKIIRTANLDLFVKDTDTSAEEIRKIAVKYGGERGNENFYEYTQGERRGSLTVWVPSASFDMALREMKLLAIKVNTETVNTQDVSAQFVDLTARLKNLRATEAQYQELMKRSATVTEVLKVTQELSTTRQQIEQIQGQLESLTGQIALSSITISLTPEASIASVSEVVSEWRPGAVWKTAVRDLQQELVLVANGFIVFIVVSLPLLLIGLTQLVFWIGLAWMLYRLGKKVYLRTNIEKP